MKQINAVKSNQDDFLLYIYIFRQRKIVRNITEMSNDDKLEIVLFNDFRNRFQDFRSEMEFK